MKTLIIFILFFTLSNVRAYELMVIQGLSKEKQTFVTRNTESTKTNHKVFIGKKSTFTANDVSIIAKAITITNEFVQWEIENHFTDVPFQRGDIVTMYDTTEYLWALTPESIKKRYIKDNFYRPRRSIETQVSFSRGLSESTSGAPAQSIDRGGFQIDATFRKEFDLNYSIAYGLRYSRDIVNSPDASLINTRFLGTLEGRYYFDPMENFYNSQITLGLTVGYGQSRSETSGQTTFGNAALIPGTKLGLMLPINKEYDVEFNASFESMRLDESYDSGTDQTTNLTNAKFGVLFRKHL